MAIKGEVHVKSMVWSPKISLNDGRYVIRPFECKIVGKAEGLARVRASIHTFFAIFDDEEWRIITLFVNHLDSKTKYTDLFAASCGSIGDFTDIKQGDDGYAMTRQMKHFNFPVRNPDGTFYAQVHPFDPSYFAVKVHPSGALLFTPHHSQLTLLQHIIIQSPFLKQPIHFLADIPKYWLEDDGTMCLDNSHRWKSNETIGAAAYARTPFSAQLHQSRHWRSSIQWTQEEFARWNCSSRPAPRAVCLLHRKSSIQWSTTWTMNLLPMSRRLNRECPCKARGYIASRPTFKLLQLLWQDIWSNGQPAQWCNGIADGLRTWGWQLAAVWLPPGPGRELWRGTLTKAQYTQRPGHLGQMALEQKKDIWSNGQ